MYVIPKLYIRLGSYSHKGGRERDGGVVSLSLPQNMMQIETPYIYIFFFFWGGGGGVEKRRVFFILSAS